jgi:hypothetical protein
MKQKTYVTHDELDEAVKAAIARIMGLAPPEERLLPTSLLRLGHEVEDRLKQLPERRKP